MTEERRVKAVIRQTLKKYWGYDDFLPLQREAAEAVLEGSDTLVILPTGGGKSICYQVPAAIGRGLALVISPLISLMKDQVDALVQCGLPAARLDSSLAPEQYARTVKRIRTGELKLLYLSPERVFQPRFLDLARSTEISFIAVDEAHCVSMWGHDFRPEYRRLGDLKEVFPKVSLHAYTATATPDVQEDIVRQLNLHNPKIFRGSFHRPNLVYRVKRRGDLAAQVKAVLERRRGESGIIYCIRRADVEEMIGELSAAGFEARPYHAGLSDEERKRNQDDFIKDRVGIIAATVAFGMGIDKPDVRFVIHAGMPKTLEHYQQESGRAGRDGLEAECHLFFSGSDYAVWRSIVKGSEPNTAETALAKLNDMYHYCHGTTCRHQILVRYFGQDLAAPCGACDVCLGEFEAMADSLILAQKIMSCVLRLKEGFGGGYTAAVLIGSNDRRILQNNHDRLSTYALLSEYSKRQVRAWIEQLAAQGYLHKSAEYSVLRVTPEGRRVLKALETPRLIKPAPESRRTRRREELDAESFAGVDRSLFEELRALRRRLAEAQGVPPFVIFGDAALRDMARLKPSNESEFLEVKGVGQVKARRFGPVFLELINKTGPADRNRPPVSPTDQAEKRRPDFSDEIEEEIFEALEALRRLTAEEKGLRPEKVLAERTLRNIARARPKNAEELRAAGVGPEIVQKYGRAILAAVKQASRQTSRGPV